MSPESTPAAPQEATHDAEWHLRAILHAQHDGELERAIRAARAFMKSRPIEWSPDR